MSRFHWLMPGFEQSIKTNLGHSNDPRSPSASVQGFLLPFSHWRRFCGPVVRPRGHNQMNSIAGLHVTSWQPCWFSTTKTFLSSGSWSPFSCKFVEIIFTVLTTYVAAMSHGCKPRTGFFEYALETNCLMLCRNTRWDCYGERILTQFPAQLCNSQSKKWYYTQNGPVMQFALWCELKYARTNFTAA